MLHAVSSTKDVVLKFGKKGIKYCAITLDTNLDVVNKNPHEFVPFDLNLLAWWHT